MANDKEKKRSGTLKGVPKLSTDPQSVMSRKRRHRIRERLSILQSMVPGANKMDTVSMLEEAIQYVKFLKTQILLHQATMSFLYDPVVVSSPLISFPSCVDSSIHDHYSSSVPAVLVTSPQSTLSLSFLAALEETTP